MKKEKAEKLEKELRAKRILRVQIAYQSAVQDLSISGYLLKKIRSGASSMQNGFMRQVNDDLQSMYTQRRALLSFRSCFLTTVIAARGVPANLPTKLRLELLLPSTVYRSDKAPSRNSRNYRSRMLDFLSQTENYQVAYTCYTSSSSMQLSDPSNPIWLSQKQNGSSKIHASPLLGVGSGDEDSEHKVGQTFVFPFTGDEICMLRLTLLQETQFGGDIELASGKIDLNVLPFDSSLSPWIDMTVRDTAVKGKAKNCAVKLAVTWLNLKGKQYKRRSLTMPTKNSTQQLSLLVSVTDAADLPRLAYGRKPLAHVDVSVGKQTYHLGKDVTSHKAAVKQALLCMK